MAVSIPSSLAPLSGFYHSLSWEAGPQTQSIMKQKFQLSNGQKSLYKQNAFTQTSHYSGLRGISCKSTASNKLKWDIMQGKFICI